MNSSQSASIRDAVVNVLRTAGVNRVFANPGSTEISLLANFPEDLNFTLALHEGSVIGMATGQALATGETAVAIVHTTAGLGNAIGAIATARVNRAPLAIIVGQQDRRHLATEPFLAGKLRGLAGEYPVWYNEPVTAQDVPAAVARAIHEAQIHKGPALVVVPMDDWIQEADPTHFFTAPASVEYGNRVSPEVISQLAHRINLAKNPVMIAGAGNTSVEGWAEAVRLAEHLHVPVFQESFAGRAGFPQDHPNFAGFISASRKTVRTQLEPYDLIFAVGAPVLRQSQYEPGAMFPAETTVLLLTEDPEEALRSPAEIAVVGSLPQALHDLVDATYSRDSRTPLNVFRREAPVPPIGDESLRASHVMAALAQRLPVETVLVEETPSSRPDLHELMPARQPFGFVSAAMGGLGFGLPAAIGLKMGAPERPVVAVLGDGSSMYGIQGLWSARHYEVGCLFIILNNERYAVMDRLSEKFGGGEPAWPSFEEINFVQLSESLGVESQRVSTYSELVSTLDSVIPTLTSRRTALTLVIDVEPELTFAP